MISVASSSKGVGIGSELVAVGERGAGEGGSLGLEVGARCELVGLGVVDFGGVEDFAVVSADVHDAPRFPFDSPFGLYRAGLSKSFILV